MRPTVNPALVTTLFLLRHGEVEAPWQGVFTGATDVELSPRGHEQARALGAYLRRVPLDAIYVSPMKRARQTLGPIVDGRDCPVITLPDLREVAVGDWTGLNGQQVLERYRVSSSAWLEQLERGAIPNGETGDMVRSRVRPCLFHIARTHHGRSVALVCHGGIIRVILSLLLDLPLAKMGGFEIDYASVTWIELQPHKNEVQLLNFTPWRDLP